jgi:hypothetical protein
LANAFEMDHANYEGNNLGVELLDKRIRGGRVEYLIRWKGRPDSENSWEEVSTISCERIKEFEGRAGNEMQEFCQ